VPGVAAPLCHELVKKSKKMLTTTGLAGIIGYEENTAVKLMEAAENKEISQ
jgi:hypothetical protein